MDTYSLRIMPKVAMLALSALFIGALPAHAQDAKADALAKALTRFKDAQTSLQSVRAGEDAATKERELMLAVLDVIAQRNGQLKEQLQQGDDKIAEASVAAVADRVKELVGQVREAGTPQELKKLATDIYTFQIIQVQAVRKMMLLSYVDRIEKLVIEPGMGRVQSLETTDAVAAVSSRKAMQEAGEALQGVRAKIMQEQLDEESLGAIEALVSKAQKSVGEAYRIFREAAMRMSEATSSPATGR